MSYQNGSLREIKQKGGRVFYFRYRRGGKEVAIRLGAFTSRWQAKEEIERLRLRDEANRLKSLDANVVPVVIADPTCREARPEANLSFGGIAGRWIKKELRKQSVTSQNGLRSYLRCHILPKWRRTLVSTMKPRDLRDWFYTLRDDEELSGETVKKIKVTMGAIFSFGVFEEAVASNPAQGWRLKGMQSDYEPVILSPSVTLQIIFALVSPLHRTLLLLVACTGLRASEAVALRWSDLSDGLIFVRRRWSAGTLDEPKSSRSKAPVACHQVLLKSLNEWRSITPYASDEDWIFPSLKMRGTIPMSAGIFVTDYLRPAAKKAGVVIPDGQRFGLHSFRSSLATWMVSHAKTDIKTAQGTLRQANPQILLDRYARAVTSEMVEAQGKFLGELWNGCGMSLLPEVATVRN